MINSIHKHLLYCLLLALVAPVVQAADEFQEGVQYRRLATAVPTSTPGKIEVIEFFWYGCPHCYRLEPDVDNWLKTKPEDVEFVRIPAVFGRDWEPGARAFYAAQALGVLDQIHAPLMDAIHAKKRPMRTEADLTTFFVEHGVSKEDFQTAYNSFDVETKLRRSQQMAKRMGISGVPSIVVDGKYETDVTMAGSGKSVFDVVNFLVSKQQDAQG
jgi:thiol:disulfide interchange protein DsbA